MADRGSGETVKTEQYAQMSQAFHDILKQWWENELALFDHAIWVEENGKKMVSYEGLIDYINTGYVNEQR